MLPSGSTIVWYICTRMIVGKDSRYKAFSIGTENGNGGVGILLAEEWVGKVYDICMISDRLMMIKLATPQVELDNTIKDAFCDLLNSTVDKVSGAETLVICADFNGHVGKVADGYEGVHCCQGYGLRKFEGERIIEPAVAQDLVLGNTHFHKKDNHLITYHSGGNSSHIDYILIRKSAFKQVRNIKVIPGEEDVTQHRLLVSDMKWKFMRQTKKTFTPRLRTWKLKYHNVINLFQDNLTHLIASDTNEKSVEDQWMNIKANLLKATEETCGISKQGKWHKQTWWWSNSVNYAVNEKRRLFKIWKEDYVLTKKVAKQTVFAAKKKTETEKLKNIENDDVTVFRIAKQIKKENKDTVGEKCIRDSSGRLACSDEEKKKAWKQHYVAAKCRIFLEQRRLVSSGSSVGTSDSCYSGDG